MCLILLHGLKSDNAFLTIPSSLGSFAEEPQARRLQGFFGNGYPIREKSDEIVVP